MPEKKKRSRFGEEFHELFPQLILPAGLGLISSYNPMAAAGVRTGLEATQLFNAMREQRTDRKWEDQAREELIKRSTERRGALEKEREEYMDDETQRNMLATFMNTGRAREGGAVIPTSKPDAATEREQLSPYFHEMFGPASGDTMIEGRQVPMMEQQFALNVGKGLSPEGQATPGTLPFAAQTAEVAPFMAEQLQKSREDVDTGPLDEQLYFHDLMAASALANPSQAANVGLWSQYQERGADLELERLRTMYDLQHMSDEDAHHLKEAEILLRKGLRVAAEREIALIKAKPIPSYGGAWAPTGTIGQAGIPEYTYHAGTPTATGGGAKSFLNLPLEEMNQTQLGERIRALTAQAVATEDKLAGSNDDAVQNAWQLVWDAEAIYRQKFGKKPAGGGGGGGGGEPSDIPDEWL